MTISPFLTGSPQTKRELADKSGYTIRDVELLIHAARLEGVPICSNTDGYWLSQDAAEVRQCADRLLHRLSVQAATAHALKATADRLEGEPKTMALGL